MSVVNPRTVKGFGAAVLNRSKTDRQDAKLIARYCQAMKPEQWQSATPEHRQLQELVRYIARTKRQRAAEQTKRQTAPDYLKPHIQSTIEHLTELLNRLEQDLKAHYRSHPEQDSRRKRLETIDGIGENAAAVLCSRPIQQRQAACSLSRARPQRTPIRDKCQRQDAHLKDWKVRNKSGVVYACPCSLSHGCISQLYRKA